MPIGVVRVATYYWQRRFREGRFTVENDQRPEASSIVINETNVSDVLQFIVANARLTVKTIANTLSISIGSAHKILCNHLVLVRVCLRLGPKLLIPHINKNFVTSCKEMLGRLFHKGLRFFQNIAMGAESWIEYYEP